MLEARDSRRWRFASPISQARYSNSLGSILLERLANGSVLASLKKYEGSLDKRAVRGTEA